MIFHENAQIITKFHIFGVNKKEYGFVEFSVQKLNYTCISYPNSLWNS